MKIRCLQTTFRQPTIQVGESDYPLIQNDLGHWIADVHDERHAAQVLSRRDTFEIYDEAAERIKAAVKSDDAPGLDEEAQRKVDADLLASLKQQQEALEAKAREQVERDKAKNEAKAKADAEKKASADAKKPAKTKSAVIVPPKTGDTANTGTSEPPASDTGAGAPTTASAALGVGGIKFIPPEGE